MNNLIPVIGTGLTGLVGSRFTRDFADTYAVTSLDISDPDRPVDITDRNQISTAIADAPGEVVFHLAAFTNVSAAWEQTGDTTGIAYRVNVEGTTNVAQACAESGKHLVHISTAYVFDGTKSSPYQESDTMNPIEWYGHTKALAEEEVRQHANDFTILRIDQPFRSDPFPKTDTAHRVIQGLQEGSLYPQFTDHYFGPTYINDLAKVFDWVIRTRPTGLYHATNNEQWSDYDFAVEINRQLNLGATVKKGSLAEYLKKTQRPYQQNTALDSSKLIEELDFSLTPISDAISEISL